MKDVENVPDSATVDSLRALIGFGKGINFTFHSQTDSIGNIIPEFMIKVLAIVMLLAALKALIFYVLGK